MVILSTFVSRSHSTAGRKFLPGPTNVLGETSLIVTSLLLSVPQRPVMVMIDESSLSAWLAVSDTVIVAVLVGCVRLSWTCCAKWAGCCMRVGCCMGFVERGGHRIGVLGFGFRVSSPCRVLGDLPEWVVDCERVKVVAGGMQGLQ